MWQTLKVGASCFSDVNVGELGTISLERSAGKYESEWGPEESTGLEGAKGLRGLSLKA